MYQIKWLLKRLGYLRRIFIEFGDTLIYQKSSQFLLHSWNGHKPPFKSILFYNLFGRILWGGREFVVKDSLSLEGYDTFSKDMQTLYTKGSHKLLWPKSPMLEFSEYKLDDIYCAKIEESLENAYVLEKEKFDKTEEWDRIAILIKGYFFDKDGHIIKEKLENFRKDQALYSELFNDQFNYLDITKHYKKSYLDAIDLILEYHRMAVKVDSTILASLSESDAGGNYCVQYRGKRVSQKSLFHALVVSDLVKNIDFNRPKRDVILDIGSGYGALGRMLKYYTPDSCHILLDLPETLVLTSYFIKYNFPDANIAVLSDIKDVLDNFDKLTKKYDFIIIPPSVLPYISSLSVDLVINTASMGFMQKEYQEFYLYHIQRTLKVGGYFYSINKEYNDQWGIGTYEWDYKADYLTLLYEYNNKFSFPQWLGQKLDKGNR